MYTRILVFAAHPDDELSMAGTIAAHAQSGAEVTLVQVTNGCEGYLKPEERDAIVRIRREEADRCDAILGIRRRIHLGQEDMSGRCDKEFFQTCIGLIRETRPDAVFTHGPSSLNRDHISIYETTREAIWQAGEPVSGDLGVPHRPRAAYFYKDYANRGPFVAYDVTAHVQTKLRAYEAYASQLAILGLGYTMAKAWASLAGGPHDRCRERFELAYFHDLAAFIE